MNSMTVTVITALITAILGPIFVEWAKVKLNSKKRSDILGESINTDEKVDHQLELLMEELQCDRICISQFHNGGHFYPTGKSIKKFSIFYEQTTDHAASIKETFQNIPVSLFPKVFSTLYKDGEINIPTTKLHHSECGLFPVEGKDYKTKSFYMLSIKDLNDDFVGALTLSYYKNVHDLTLEEWILLRQKVGAIGTILTDYLHDKK
jgi:hypothetical protein